VVIKPFSLSSRLVSSTCDSVSLGSRNCAAPTSTPGFAPSSRCGSRWLCLPDSARPPAVSNSSSSVSLPNTRLNASSSLSYPTVLSTRFPRSFAILASNVVLIRLIIRLCQTLPLLPHDHIWRSSRAIYPLADLSHHSSTGGFQKYPDAGAVGGSGHFWNLPVRIVYLTPGTGPCESHIIDEDASPPTSQWMT